MWNNLILLCANALITWWHFLCVSKEHNCWKLAINSSADIWSISGPLISANIYKIFKENTKMSWHWYSGNGRPVCCFWSLRELSRISFNELSHTGDSSRRAGACMIPPRFAFQHVITVLRRWQGRGSPFRAPHSLPFCDACLLKGFIYHHKETGKTRRKCSWQPRVDSVLCISMLIMTAFKSPDLFFDPCNLSIVRWLVQTLHSPVFFGCVHTQELQYNTPVV